MARPGTRPTSNKTNYQSQPSIPASQKQGAEEQNYINDKINNSGLNEAWTSIVSFNDTYYPDPYTMTGPIEYTINGTNAGNGNKRKDTITGDGNTITFTGFVIRDSTLVPASNVVTTVAAKVYTIVFERVGAVSEVYLWENNATSTGDVDASINTFNPSIGAASEKTFPLYEATGIINFVKDASVSDTVTGGTFPVNGYGGTIKSLDGAVWNFPKTAFIVSGCNEVGLNYVLTPEIDNFYNLVLVWTGQYFIGGVAHIGANTSLPTLATPTISTIAGDGQITLTIDSEDPAATGRAWLKSTTNDIGTGIAVAGYDDSLSFIDTDVVNETTYYLWFYNTASGYQNSATVPDSVTPTDSSIQLTALILGTSLIGDTEILIPFVNPNSSNEDQNQLYYKLATEPTIWTAGVVAATGSTVFPDQTGLTNGLLYNFKAVAEGSLGYSDSNDSNTINAIPNYILFQDDFTGTVIDTAKWVNTPSADIGITQNDNLIFTDLTTVASGTLGLISTDTKFSRDTTSRTTVIRFDIDRSGATIPENYFSIDFIETSNEIIRFERDGGAPNINGTLRIKQGGTWTTSTSTGVDITGSWKIVIESGTASIFKYGTGWGASLVSGPYNDMDGYILTSRSGGTTINDITTVDNIAVTSTDFATLNP